MKKKLIEIPEELFKQIEAFRKKECKEVNKEIVFLLTSSVGKKIIVYNAWAKVSSLNY